MTLWYLANGNSFREISDKFCVARGSACKIIRQVLQLLVMFAASCIKWWDDVEKISWTLDVCLCIKLHKHSLQ